MKAIGRVHGDIRKAVSISMVLILHLMAWRSLERSWQDTQLPRPDAHSIQARLVPPMEPTRRAAENPDHSTRDRAARAATERAQPGQHVANRPASLTTPVHDAQQADTSARNEREHTSSTQAGTLIDNALKSAGRVDKEIRQESPKRFGNEATQRSAMERAVGSAGKSRTTTMEDITAPDGTRMTKVSGPSGTYCVLQHSAATAAGLDLLERGMAQRTVNCP